MIKKLQTAIQQKQAGQATEVVAGFERSTTFVMTLSVCPSLDRFSPVPTMSIPRTFVPPTTGYRGRAAGDEALGDELAVALLEEDILDAEVVAADGFAI